MKNIVESESNKYVIVRTYSAGVFAGYLEKKNGKEVVIRNARRIWYWDGAASLSELAVKGVSRPENCKFPCEVPRVELTECIEILDATEEAKNSIASVPIWLPMNEFLIFHKSQNGIDAGSGDGIGNGAGNIHGLKSGYGDSLGNTDCKEFGDAMGFDDPYGHGFGYGFGYGQGDEEGCGGDHI